MTNPLRPVSESLDAVVDKLRTSAPKQAPARKTYALGNCWMPELEDESASYPLRLRGGVAAIAAYRHALAVTQHQWPKRIEARVLVRDAGKRVHAFNARFIGPDLRTQKLDPVHCCRACGCTQDRACEGGCGWAKADLCTACAHG